MERKSQPQRYSIVQALSASLLSSMVNEMIAQGYEPLGPPQVYIDPGPPSAKAHFIQAVVKRAEK